MRTVSVIFIVLFFLACQEAGHSTNENEKRASDSLESKSIIATDSNEAVMVADTATRKKEQRGQENLKGANTNPKEKGNKEVTPLDPPSEKKVSPRETEGREKDTTVHEEKVTKAEETPEKQDEAPVESTSGLHDSWDALLKKYVSPTGYVNYTDWKKEEDKLDQYLTTLSNNTPGPGWSDDKAMAYWINAYNAFTVKLILKNYPVSKITNLHNGKPWDVKWIDLGNNTYSLNQIEHEILRKKYGDARIHFAVNCAAKSCPPLMNQAFNASGLDATLDRLAKKFINNRKFNQISSDNLQLSKIFDWYREDFGNLRTYVDQYSDLSIQSDASISFNEYDWSLNGK